ncbi:MAG: hypothetical protein AAF721_41285 [Myxococcota bacterium]
MKIGMWIVFGLLFVQSVATGAVKIGQLQADIDIFAKLGFSAGMTTAFGVVQLVLGLALLHPGARKAAAAALAVTFAVATAGLFVAGIHPFSYVSLLFIALTVPVILGKAPPARA